MACVHSQISKIFEPITRTYVYTHIDDQIFTQSRIHIKLEKKKAKELARRERFAEAEKERKREEKRKIQEWWSEVHTINRVFHSKAKPSKRARRNQERHGKQRK